MRASKTMCLIVVAACCTANVALAHHSQSMFVETPVWVTGTIVKYRATDPHVMIELAEPQSSGKPNKWIIEGPRMGRLDQILQNNGGIAASEILKAGDRISVCGFPLKKDFSPERMYAEWPPEQGRFVHGQVLRMPDGRLQSWGPYGVIDNCVRKSDSASTWVAFLNRDPLAARQWCDALGYKRLAHHTPTDFIDQVNGGLAMRCQ